MDRILGKADDLPRWGTEKFFDHYEERLGGQGANFAIAAARLGFETFLVGNVGDDLAG
jgi:sugar/nucleoside kinase (ribokinase family)